MSIKVGTTDKSDVLIEIELESTGGCHINLKSKVEKIFGKQIRQTVQETLKHHNIENALVTIEDNGALDFIIRARLKTAIRQLKGEL
jgi:citrate lyase subunit gamma (acyl carrier protein)